MSGAVARVVLTSGPGRPAEVEVSVRWSTVVSKSKGKNSLKSSKVVPVPQLTSNPTGRPPKSKGK